MVHTCYIPAQLEGPVHFPFAICLHPPLYGVATVGLVEAGTHLDHTSVFPLYKHQSPISDPTDGPPRMESANGTKSVLGEANPLLADGTTSPYLLLSKQIPEQHWACIQIVHKQLVACTQHWRGN